MFHPHVQRLFILAAGIVFLAYALTTDEHTEKDTSTDDDRDGPDTTGDEPVGNVVDTASEGRTPGRQDVFACSRGEPHRRRAFDIIRSGEWI